MMGNEAKTENLVRGFLREQGYYGDSSIIIEEKKSDNPRIDKLLRNASKRGGKQGYPEFIISAKTHSEFIIVIECKADISKHVSQTMDCYPDFAVDGALLYASFLSKEYDVVAIGVSGESLRELRISHYLYLKEMGKYYSYFPDDKILPFGQYYEGVVQSDYKLSQDYDKLVAYTRTLNELLHGKKIKESERALLISGILISLRNDAFKTGYLKHKSAKALVDTLYSTVCTELDASGVSRDNAERLRSTFGFIKSNTSLTDEAEGKQFTERLISDIDKEINSFMRTHKYFDAISEFYVEFLRYANQDKGLGIVLTPRHITDLYADLAEINKDSVVFDNCCGTGGFLVSAMRKMTREAKGDKRKEKEVKERQLVGIEYDLTIYALLISNMIVHQDGRTSMYRGDCFKEGKKVRQRYMPTVGLLNPPYKTKGSPREELEFVLNNLDCLEEGGKCVALVPMSCVIETTGIAKELKRQILKEHTLEAVMSMPDELFHGQTAPVTCTVVITAHKPHPAGKKTWFGYWRDDGFVKVKHRGRVDRNHTWERTRSLWLNTYRNRESVDGLSLTREVTETDEWCVEAYMNTEYSSLPMNQYEESIRQFMLFSLETASGPGSTNTEGNFEEIKTVELHRLFTPKNGLASSRVKRNPVKLDNTYVPYICPSHRQDTSIDGFVSKNTVDSSHVFPKGTLYASTDGQGSHTFSYVSVFEFVPNSNVTVLIPKREMALQEKLYYAWCITSNRYRFSYGRKPKKNRLKSLMLPECPPPRILSHDIRALMKDLLDNAEPL